MDQATSVSSFMTTMDGHGIKRKPKGAVLFTGPDGIGDYRVKVEEPMYIGNGSMSPEASSDVKYLCRAAPGFPHPLPKSKRVGEIGWGIPSNADYTLLSSGHQIMLKEFRQAAEDKRTHDYQEPYYPPPNPLPSIPSHSSMTGTTPNLPEPSLTGPNNIPKLSTSRSNTDAVPPSDAIVMEEQIGLSESKQSLTGTHSTNSN